MRCYSLRVIFPFVLSILLSSACSKASLPSVIHENGWKSSVFSSPPFILGPGSVVNDWYYDIDFPRGHIALKAFDAEVVDEFGNSIPLHETYLHHWVLMRYYAPISSEENGSENIRLSKPIVARNSGVCQGNVLGQYYGLGSETRRTPTEIPDPYGIEVGNPWEIPRGYEEKWLLNVHAIDTRGAVDRMGCIECRCDLYNVTVDEYGRPLTKDYKGGLFCCYHQTQCRVLDGFEGPRRKLSLKYIVKWLDWDQTIVPVRIYILDVTDSGKRANSSQENARLGCQIEYEVQSCRESALTSGGCTHTKRSSAVIPRGGDLIYGVAHQHWGGIGTTLYGQDGRELCSSIPTYGKGKEAGNEADYIVGMSTCYPKPGSVRIADGEIVTFESNYSNAQMHTGVMGLSYICLADPRPVSAVFSVDSNIQVLASSGLPHYTWALVFVGLLAALIAGMGYLAKKGREDYQLLDI